MTPPPIPREDLRAWLETDGAERVAIGDSAGIGRSGDNVVMLPGEKVSRHHALIQSRDQNVFWLTDLGSSNGTVLNGRRITEPSRLYDQDRITIGPWHVVFRQPGTRPRPAVDYSLTQGTLSLRDSHPVSCWMLVLDVGSLADLSRRVPPQELARLTSGLCDTAADLVLSRGGRITRYLGNGFLASWEGAGSLAHAVARTLAELQRLQAESPVNLRFVLHHGLVTAGTGISRDEQKIVGPEAGFVLRVNKLAASLQLPSLVSDAAARLLKGHLALVDAGRHMITGYPEPFTFHHLPAHDVR